MIDRWSEMRKGDVISPVVGLGLPRTALRLVGETLGLPGLRLASLLDPTPMRRSVDRWVDWLAVHRNVRNGSLESICVVATSLADGQPVGFVHSQARHLPQSDEIRYMKVRLSSEHVRASAAIPLLFPPVEVTSPAPARGFYIDGGTRLNTPIKPALALGAQRVIVVGFEPLARPAPTPIDHESTPRLADVAANILDGLLVDQVADDLRRLTAINSFFADDPAGGPSMSARGYRTSRGREPYRKISYALVSPERAGELGATAENIVQERYGGLRALLNPDYPLLSLLLGGSRRSRAELLSFLLFDEVFVQELIKAGGRDANRWLDRHPNFWCSDAAHDFDIDQSRAEMVREQSALREYRELGRR
jgi:NTE family protein